MTRVSVDLNGTPGVLAETVAGAYWGLGWIHGYYRPMQTLLIATAGRGEMSQRLISNDELVQMDALIHRHGIVEPGTGGRSRCLGREKPLHMRSAELESAILALAAGGSDVCPRLRLKVRGPLM